MPREKRRGLDIRAGLLSLDTYCQETTSRPGTGCAIKGAITMSTLGQRLEEAMSFAGLNASQLSRATARPGLPAISPGHISHLKKGTRGKEPTADTIARLAQACGVDPGWLRTGEGPSPGAQGLPRVLQHRPEWAAVAASVREQHPELPDDAVRAVGELPEMTAIVPVLDVAFVRDLAVALAALRARAAHRAR